MNFTKDVIDKVLEETSMRSTCESAARPGWTLSHTFDGWKRPIAITELLKGKDSARSKIIRIYFQVFHTDVRNLNAWKVQSVDNDLRRPIFTTEFPGAEWYLNWIAENGPHLQAIYVRHRDRSGVYLEGHQAPDCHRLMCFSAWLGQVVQSYQVPAWCTARAFECGKGNWNVWCCDDLKKEELERAFREGAGSVIQYPDFSCDPPTSFKDNRGNEIDLANIQDVMRRKWIDEMKAATAANGWQSAWEKSPR